MKTKLKYLKKSLAKKIFDKKNRSSKILETDKIKSILFFRDDDKIGDMTVSTLLFREIKKKYRDVKIIVLCGKNNREIIKYNNNVDEIYEAGGSFFQDVLIFKKLAKQRINLAVDFYQFMPRFKHLLMLRLIAPEFLIGFYKQSYNIYDFSIDVDFFDVHISKKYEYLLKILKIEDPDLKYDIIFTSKEDKKAFSAVKNGCNKKYKLVLNSAAASRHRSFDYCKLKELISLIENNFDCCVFVLCNVNNTKKIKSLANDRTFIVCFKSVLETSALIKYADVVITPDTSIVHISAAFNKKTIALYLDYSNTYEKINLIWGPNNPNAVQLSVSTKNNIVKNDIKNISSDLIVKKLKEFLE